MSIHEMELEPAFVERSRGHSLKPPPIPQSNMKPTEKLQWLSRHMAREKKREIERKYPPSNHKKTVFDTVSCHRCP